MHIGQIHERLGNSLIMCLRGKKMSGKSQDVQGSGYQTQCLAHPAQVCSRYTQPLFRHFPSSCFIKAK